MIWTIIETDANCFTFYYRVDTKFCDTKFRNKKLLGVFREIFILICEISQQKCFHISKSLVLIREISQPTLAKFRKIKRKISTTKIREI
jgi:hypothetical protein